VAIEEKMGNKVKMTWLGNTSRSQWPERGRLGEGMTRQKKILQKNLWRELKGYITKY
jgi:hypothetical protein